MSSPQFVLPLVFAVSAMPKISLPTSMRLDLAFMRDDRNQPGPAFKDMPPLKVVTLISELSNAVVYWVSEVGARFNSLEIIDDNMKTLRLSFDFCMNEEYQKLRSVELIKAGIEMMAFARGLKVEFGAS